MFQEHIFLLAIKMKIFLYIKSLSDPVMCAFSDQLYDMKEVSKEIVMLNLSCK